MPFFDVTGRFVGAFAASSGGANEHAEDAEEACMAGMQACTHLMRRRADGTFVWKGVGANTVESRAPLAHDTAGVPRLALAALSDKPLSSIVVGTRRLAECADADVILDRAWRCGLRTSCWPAPFFSPLFFPAVLSLLCCVRRRGCGVGGGEWGGE